MKNKILTALLITKSLLVLSQSNTATTSGSIGKCAVWGYPYTLYNNASATQTVNSGVTVTVDQNRNAGAIVLSGSGAMDLSGSNGITMSGSGNDTNCRWDIVFSGSGTLNNTNHLIQTGTVFTAPYTGTYRWTIGSGWSADISGSYLSGILAASVNGSWQRIYNRNEAGDCGLVSSPAAAASWASSLLLPLSTGGQLSYAASSVYNSTSSSCTGTQMNYSLGNAVIYYEN